MQRVILVRAKTATLTATTWKLTLSEIKSTTTKWQTKLTPILHRLSHNKNYKSTKLTPYTDNINDIQCKLCEIIMIIIIVIILRTILMIIITMFMLLGKKQYYFILKYNLISRYAFPTSITNYTWFLLKYESTKNYESIKQK